VSARYLIRLDDACDTMDRRRWDAVERLLDHHGVQPIVAIIPDNRDPKLQRDDRDTAFWAKVGAWARKGWDVAMHGHTHVMHPINSAGVLPFYKRSEFAGLTLAAQSEKVRRAWSLFVAQGIQPKIWVAPAHSFDLLTLEAVRNETPIRILSDGIAWNTYYEHGFHWIPQQLWALVERRSGVWTVCLHPNAMDDGAVDALGAALAKFRGRLTCVKNVALTRRSKGALDRIYHGYFWWRWRQGLRTA
jgi:predicted deacetylase